MTRKGCRDFQLLFQIFKVATIEGNGEPFFATGYEHPLIQIREKKVACAKLIDALSLLYGTLLAHEILYRCSNIPHGYLRYQFYGTCVKALWRDDKF